METEAQRFAEAVPPPQPLDRLPRESPKHRERPDPSANALLSTNARPESEHAVGRTGLPPERARVLVIDDELLVGKAYRRMLEPLHEVVLAQSGREGLERLCIDQNFDVVICDLTMPDVDGPMVYEYLAKHHSTLVSRLVFASGGAFTVRASTFVQNTRNVCLDKPLSRKLLLSVIEQVAAQTRRREPP